MNATVVIGTKTARELTPLFAALASSPGSAVRYQKAGTARTTRSAVVEGLSIDEVVAAANLLGTKLTIVWYVDGKMQTRRV